MLAMFGLLEGFESSSGGVGRRSVKYYKYASKYSSLFIDTNWDDQSAATMCRQIANTISVELVHLLTEEKEANGGKLGLLDKVPERLELPSPKERKPQPEPVTPPDPPPPSSVAPTSKYKTWLEKIWNYLRRLFEAEREATQDVAKLVSSSQAKLLIIAGCVLILSVGVVIVAQLGNLEHDMSEFIQEAQSPLIVDLDAGEYTMDDLRELICKRILSNPIYGDMVARGFIDADPRMREKIGENNPWLYEFIEESRSASDEDHLPDMSHWLKEYGGQLFTTKEYKQYADPLCKILRSFAMEKSICDFSSTDH